MYTFIKPIANMRVTSPFGMRTHPLTGKQAKHNGIDVVGSDTILAVADGKCVKSYSSKSYGETIILDHHINGKQYQSLYAHLSKRNIKRGDVVKQGNIIGFMGNTGHSSGKHLHFELHQPTWTSNKEHALNPMQHLDKKVSVKLVEDGIIGVKTVTRLQEFLNTRFRDGKFSNQRKNDVTNKVPLKNVCTFSDTGQSTTVQTLQKRIGTKPDGLIGKHTVKALCVYLDIKHYTTFNYYVNLALQKYLNKF